MYWEITINILDCVYIGLLIVCIMHAIIIFGCVPESGEEFTSRKALVFFSSVITLIVSLSAVSILYDLKPY